MVFHKYHTYKPIESRFAVRGFTLVEAVVAISLISVGVAITLGTLSKFNSIAATSRNATGATALLQTQVDLFQTMSPFNPQSTPAPKDLYSAHVPPTYDMTVGTHIIGYPDPTNLDANGQPIVVDPCSRPANDRDTWPVYREPARWNYANATARTGASGFVASEIGQLAYQKDDQTFWRLQSTAPTWSQEDARGMIVKGTMTCTVTDMSATIPNTYKAVFTIGYQYMGRGPISNTNYKPCGSQTATTRSEYQQSMTILRSSDI